MKNNNTKRLHLEVPFHLAIAAGFIGVSSLLGWYMDIRWLITYADGHPLISIVTAFLLTLSSMALALITRHPRSLTAIEAKSTQFLGVLIVLVAGVSVFEALFRETMDVHSMGDIHGLIAAALFPNAPWAALHPHSLTASSFILVGCLLILASAKGNAPRRHRVLAVQGLALCILLIAFLALVAHLFDARDLYVGKSGLGMSLPASIGLLFLGVAAMGLYPRLGLMAIVTSPTSGGRAIRWLVPSTVAAMVCIEWLVVQGRKQGWYDDAYGAALSTLVATTTLILLLVGVAHRLNWQEKKARSSQELLETLFANFHSMVAYFDRDFRFIRVNDAYARAVGESPTHFIGKRHFDLYPNAENEAIFRTVAATGQPYTTYAKPFAYPDRPDEITYWDWVLSPVKSESGETEGLLLSMSNATDRKRGEEKRLRAEQDFRELFDAASDALFVLNLEGQFIAVNETACSRLGYSRAELLGMGPTGIDSPEYRERIPERMRELMQTGYIVFESEHCSRDGHRIPVEISARRMDFSGQPAILSIARDISTRKALEHAQQVSVAQTQAMLDSSRESSILLAPDGRVLAINQTAASRLKSTPEALVGRNAYDLFPPEVAGRRRRVIEQVIAERRPMDYQDQRAGFFFDQSVHPILDGRGQVEQIAIHAVDITDKVRALGVEKLFHEIDRQIQQGLRLEDLLSYVCSEVSQLFSLSLVWVGQKKPDKQISLLSAAGPAKDYQARLEEAPPRWDDSPLGRGPAGSAIRTGRDQLVSTDAPGFSPWQEASSKYGFSTVYATPLTIESEIFGVIAYYSDTPTFFQDKRVASSLGDIANRICVAISFARQQERMQLLSNALSVAGNSIFITNKAGRIQWVNNAFTQLTGYTLTDAYQQTPRMLKSGKQDAAYYNELWKTIQSGRIWNREAVEKRKDGALFTVQQTITPIFSPDGEITHFVSIQEDISERKAAEERIQHMAYFDALTNLPNRALFFDRLHQAITQARRTGQVMAVFFLDLDRFKLVNDNLGHEIGDLLLQEVARRLEKCVRESDTVARLGGDEFTIILTNLDEPSDAAIAAQKAVAALSVPFELGGQTVQTGTSLGIAFYPEHGVTADELVKAADDAMYEAKSQGRGTYRFSGSTD